MKKYLIVGASGFIGGNILSILPSKIDITIITSNKKKILKRLTKKKFSKVLIKKYIFISSKNKKIIQEQDVIINCTGVYPNKKNNKKIILLNYKLPKKLFDLSLNQSTKKFININTLLKNRESIYVKYKHKLSDYLRKNKGNTSVIDLHVSHLYGDIRNKKNFINNIIVKILKNRRILKLTKGQQKRDFLHIKDFKKLFLKILKFEPNKKYYKFEIGSYKSYSIKSVIILIKKITNSNINVSFGYFDYKKGEDFSMKCNIKSLKNIKWEPKISLTSGIKLLLKDFQKILF